MQDKEISHVLCVLDCMRGLSAVVW